MGGSRFIKKVQVLFSPPTPSSSSEGMPRLSLHCVLSHPHGLFPMGRAYNTSTGEASRRHFEQMSEPLHLAPLNAGEQHLYSVPPLKDRFSHYLKERARTPCSENSFQLLAFAILFFQSQPTDCDRL